MRNLSLLLLCAVLALFVGCQPDAAGGGSGLIAERTQILRSTPWKLDVYRSELDTKKGFSQYSPVEQVLAEGSMRQMYFAEFLFNDSSQLVIDINDGTVLRGAWEFRDSGKVLYLNTSAAEPQPFDIRHFSADSIVLPADKSKGHLYTMVLVPLSATVTPPPATDAPSSQEEAVTDTIGSN